MKAPRFEYEAPRTLDDALAILAQAPDDTSLLAGGQSLMPMLNLRLARPRVLVDLNRVEGLGAVARVDGRLRIGAMVRQRTLESDGDVAAGAPLLREAAGLIAHVPIRTRGTVGGSLAHADPSAELPAAVTALDARMRLQGAHSAERWVDAREFFAGPLTTAIAPGEMLVDVEVPLPGPGTGWCFREVARTHGAFALVGAAALLRTAPDGRVADARLALCGLGGAPYIPEWLGSVMVGELPDEALLTTVAARIREEVDPSGDAHAGPEYRRRVAGVLSARALAVAARRAREPREP
jgi:aerobic carbon-monoxide dehydrogenase medium subunit